MDVDRLTDEELAAELEAARATIEQLQTALDSRIVIEQAKGILAERYGWKVTEAFEVLRYAARSSGTNIHVVATRVVDEPRTPKAVVVAIARSARWRAALMRERTELTHERNRALHERLKQQQENQQQLEERIGKARRPKSG